jgi:VWFA-related protein
MRTSKSLLLICACVAGLYVAGRAQNPPAADTQDSQKVVVGSAEVLFDVVVRDKRGRAVTDLSAADFEVYEDGVRQQLNSFRLVAREPAGKAAVAASNAGGAETSKNEGAVPVRPRTVGAEEGARLSAVAIVFDRLTPDARARARQAALGYVGEKDDLVGVFLTDLSLVTLQPFTDDMNLVRQAIEKAGVGSPSLYTSNNEEARAVRKELGDMTELEKRNPASGAGKFKKILELMLWDLETWEEVQREQQGNATMSSLLKLTTALRALPGRKAVILFSEGLVLPPSAQTRFQEVINAANRNNVSVYTIDAAGLRATSKTQETRLEIESRSALRMIQETTNEESKVPMTKGLERNEDLLYLNPDSGLGQLANQTGGFYITDTNDVRAGLRRVDDDLHSYYMMSYAPQDRNYDGRYRRIEVKVRRPGVVVQSRKGYYAIDASYASPVLAYEVPALALLGKRQRPDAFPVQAAGFSFPETGGVGLAPLLVEGRAGEFTFQVDNEKKVYKTDFSIVVVIRDEAGRVAKKLSNRYELSGPVGELEAAKQGRVLFYREAELPPGNYRFEAVAFDTPTGRASMREGTFEVPEADEGRLRMSSVVIIKRAEKTPAGQKAAGPFHVGDLLVYPNLGEATRKEASKQLPFFFTLYAPAGQRVAPKLSVELRQNGKTLARLPAELNEPDALGRYQYLAALPLESIPAGEYELKVTAAEGTNAVSSSTRFTVEK